MNAYNTHIPPILGGFPCWQAHNLLTCDQLDLKDKFSPIKNAKKYNILTKISATAPLTDQSDQKKNSKACHQKLRAL